MKKIISILLVFVAFCFCLISCQEKAEATVQLVEETIKKDNEVSFVIKVLNAPPTQTYGFKIKFDESVFTLINNELLTDTSIFFDFSSNDKKGVVAFSNLTDINCDIFKFTLKANKSVENTVVSCDLSIKDKNNKSVEIKVIPWEGNVE